LSRTTVFVKYYYLEKAISLHYQAKLEGGEILLFPEKLNPDNFDYSTVSNTHSKVNVMAITRLS
jgi:hypothetical protein